MPARTRRRAPMTQYLLSVHMVEGEPSRRPRTRCSRCTPTSTRSTTSCRRRAPGCSPAACTRRHRHRRAGRRTARSLTTDGPFAETKEQLGGFWVIEAADLDAALALGRQGAGGLQGAGRGAAVPGRARGLDGRDRRGRRTARAGLPRGVRPGGGHPGPPLRRHRHRRGGGPGGVRRRRRALAGDGRAAEPGRLDHHHRPQPGHRPAAPRVVPRRPPRPGRAARTSPTSRRARSDP